MKRLLSIIILASGLILSPTAWSQNALSLTHDFFAWTPKVFKVEESVMAQSLDELDKAKDSSTLKTFALYSDFKKDFIQLFTDKYIAEFQNRFEPDAGYGDPIENIFDEIKFLGGWMLEVFGYDFQDEGLYYGYCEANPGSVEPICEGPAYSPIYALIVRSASTESFLNNACDPFVDVVTWKLGWGPFNPNGDLSKKKEFFDSLDNILSAIAYLENNGQWEVSAKFMKKLETFNMPYSIEKALRRRHYDRGPKFMQNLADCVGHAKQRISLETAKVIPSPEATKRMQEVFYFKKFTLPKGVSEIKNPFRDSTLSSRFSNYIDLYRLFRQFPEAYPVALNTDSWEIYNSDDIVLRGATLERLLKFINVVDENYRYQMMTVEDVKKGIFKYKSGYGFGGLGSSFCVTSSPGNFATVKIDRQTGSVTEEKAYRCSVSNFLFEKKLKIQ